LRLFQDNSGNIVGFGVSNNLMETHVPSGAAIAWYVNNSHVARITSGGNFGIGTTAPNKTGYDANGRVLTVYGPNRGILELGSDAPINSDTLGGVDFLSSTTNKAYVRCVLDGSANGQLTFGTNNTERARITAGGYFKASNSGTYLSSTASYHEFYQSANAQALRVYASDSSTYNNDVLTVDGERTTTNSTYNLGNFRNGNGTGQCIIRDSGNIVNTNSSYGAISDQKLKQDIVDAASQWDDIKGVRVRKFRYKTDSTAPLQIGVIAQELEQVSPGLVDEAPDYEEVEVTDEEGNVTTERQPTGTSTKSVKYSILYMKAVKALQEAMARIEQLEADMAALKASA